MHRFTLISFAVAISLGVGLILEGCDSLFGLQRLNDPVAEKCTEPSPPPECPVRPMDNGYTCTCTCDGSDTVLRVCVPPELNPNLKGGSTPTAAQLMMDCKNRVHDQVQKMDNKCYVPNPSCNCFTADPLPDTFQDDACDSVCPKIALADGCTNWDPKNGVKEATCAPTLCDDPGPVCLTASSDPPVPVPSALAAGLMGRVSTCRVTAGTATVKASDQTRQSALRGEIDFAPAAPGSCAAGQTCLTMNYRLDTTQTLHFDGIGILGIGDTDIENVETVGASTPFALGTSGISFLAEEATHTTGRGFENGTRRGAVGSNSERVVVGYDGETCGVQGHLLAGLGDPDGDNADADLAVNVTGVVDNTPPTASLGSDRSVECTSSTGADVVLDATSSSDGEDNIVTYSWFRGSRAGTSLGTGSTLTVHQALGAQTYFVKAIDAYMQADEASAKLTVADTTAPTIACNVPATITPSKTPYAFTATAQDTCDAALAAPVITSFECLAENGSGLIVNRGCKVRVSGSTFTIVDSAGIGNVFRWRVSVPDANGNAGGVTCQTQVVKKK